MRLRQKRGGTLALVAAATITLILLGICFFFLAQIFGGEREIQHATDSGNLNVAKNALRKPAVAIKAGEEFNSFGQLGDRTLIGNAPPASTTSASSAPPVNLLTYNRMFAHALLAAVNAQRDGGSGAGNVTKMIDALQSGQNSIGGRLSTELSKKSGNELFSDFGATANQNSLRMLGNNSVLGHKDSEFSVAFLEQNPADDIGATNIEVTDSVRNLFSSALQGTIFTTKGGKTYLRGYVAPSTTAGTPVGVPVQPGDQPHLVSNKTFSNQESRGSAFKNFMVPPNGFRSHTQAAEERSSNNASTLSCAEVGSLNMTFPLSIPYGYIKIVNGPDDGTAGAATVSGPFAGLDHVLNNELLEGILVSGPVFAEADHKDDRLDAWAKYNKDVKDGRDPGKQPPLDGLYDLQGNPAKLADAQKIPFDSDGNAIATTCTDENSTGWSRSDPDVIPQCWDLLGNGTGNGAFDKAYHGGGTYQVNPGSATDLIAVECAKCQLQHKFNTCGSLTVNQGNCGVTGLRVPSNKDWSKEPTPSASMGNCLVSKTATVEELGNWVSPGFGTQMVNWISERCNQINPANGEAQAKSELAKNPLALGSVWYIYAAGPDNGQKDLKMTTQPPPWLVAGTVADGAKKDKSRSYNIVQTAVNPQYDGGIHDIMYREHPSSGINATDTATWIPSSGYQNLLGKVTFTDTASGTAAGFCKPD